MKAAVGVKRVRILPPLVGIRHGCTIRLKATDLLSANLQNMRESDTSTVRIPSHISEHFCSANKETGLSSAGSQMITPIFYGIRRYGSYSSIGAALLVRSDRSARRNSSGCCSNSISMFSASLALSVTTESVIVSEPFSE